jgi:hypothetical protein
MCRVDILDKHIVSAWYSLENQVLQYAAAKGDKRDMRGNPHQTSS